jgi:hypothetical protein
MRLKARTGSLSAGALNAKGWHGIDKWRADSASKNQKDYSMPSIAYHRA